MSPVCFLFFCFLAPATQPPAPMVPDGMGGYVPFTIRASCQTARCGPTIRCWTVIRAIARRRSIARQDRSMSHQSCPMSRRACRRQARHAMRLQLAAMGRTDRGRAMATASARGEAGRKRSAIEGITNETRNTRSRGDTRGDVGASGRCWWLRRLS